MRTPFWRADEMDFVTVGLIEMQGLPSVVAISGLKLMLARD